MSFSQNYLYSIENHCIQSEIPHYDIHTLLMDDSQDLLSTPQLYYSPGPADLLATPQLQYSPVPAEEYPELWPQPVSQHWVDPPVDCHLDQPYFMDQSYFMNQPIECYQQEQPLTKRKETPFHEKKYACPVCDHRSKRRHNMIEHMQTHNPNRPKLFSCQLCQRAFARKYDMKRHEKIHYRN
ncbi:hypothetical protein G6F37_011620 [Rhizopus arrhizus]|nr:hypothetical protein G6F38_011705 [Rhizopus arrhizus]KAG1148355.1 hypothetical protein G6F37_011620 [Rhizopus arrhizus]